MTEIPLSTCLLLAVWCLLLLQLHLQLLQVVGRSAQWVQAPTSHQISVKYVWPELSEPVCGMQTKKVSFVISGPRCTYCKQLMSAVPPPLLGTHTHTRAGTGRGMGKGSEHGS